MDKEEAIEYLKNLIKNSTISQDPFYTTKIAIDTALNYIEELEEKIKVCTDTGAKLIDTKFIKNNYIPKQKVRDKIEELEKQEKIELKGMKGQDRYFVKQVYQYKKQVLEELLEEEKNE